MKEIQLTQGKVALVDDEDFEWLNQFKWCAFKHGNTFYAVRGITVNGKRELRYMHRAVLGVTNSRMQVDHIRGNGLNNQRLNLREATSAQNQANRGSFGSSIYKGVFKMTNRPGFVSRISYKRKSQYLGYFRSEIIAAKTYDRAALNLYGEFARLNFP